MSVRADPTTGGRGLGNALRALVFAASCGLGLGAAGVAAQQPGAGRFDHANHRSLTCTECHATGRATSTADRSWCADCHHVSVTIAECDRCHDPSGITPEPRRALVTFDRSVGEPVTRSIVFDHGIHTGLACSECHTSGGPGMAADRECTSCHVRHHEPGVDCTSCHAEPPVTAHAPEMHQALAGCGAAGCHQARGIDFAALAGERNLCLACHVAQKEHEQGAQCVACHILGSGEPEGRRNR